MLVILDIPLEAPVTIDWLPVGFIFMIFYSVVGLRHGEDKAGGTGEQGTFSRGWAVLGRWWLLLLFLLTGGGIYYAVSGVLPKEVRKGIESFGMRADLRLPYPSDETIHLHGSMIMLVFFALGWRLLVNKALPPALARPATTPANAAIPRVTVPKPVIAVPPPPPVIAEVPVSGRNQISMRIPEPVEVKAPAGRSCVYVAMPAGLTRKRISYPCIVEDGIRPSIRRKELSQQT